jgi:hypothetical protein
LEAYLLSRYKETPHEYVVALAHRAKENTPYVGLFVEVFFFEQGLAPKAPYFIQLTGSTQHGLQHYEIATVGLQYE